ncbi:MAG: tetratricopeptide repeat protein [Bryobacteraceae bacterium]|nr:tetratricopeptide repeat protein [Bryobacterales bacterium]MEB2362168.1 tetratricopeptide repeat protein [Bryobacterales bacterium]NUM99787.1 tetratricopeptide repeat protein [Bryobacteraceae bacterium]
MRLIRLVSSIFSLALLTGFPVSLLSQNPPAGGGQGAPVPQQGAPPQGGSVPGGSIPGREPTPGRQPGRDPFPRQDQMDPNSRMPMPEMERPIFLSGKVVMEDGTPPPETVTIERVCNGIARPEGYTDSKGRFSFQLGQNVGVFQDASVSSQADPGFGGRGMGSSGRQGGMGFPGNNRGLSERDLMGCELRASLPGFRSEIVNLSGRRVMDNPDVGTIIMRRLGNVEGLTISATSALAPKDARKAFDKGRKAIEKKKWEEARKELNKAVETYPKYAAAWFYLGLVHERNKDMADARQAYAQALEADAKYVNPYLQLADIAAREQNWQEAADTTDRLLKLNPFDFPRAYLINAVANLNLQKIDAAEASAREAVKLDTSHQIPQVSHVLGVILAQKRDYPGALAQMRAYLEHAPKAGNAQQVREQITQIENLMGKTTTAQEQK